MVLVEIATSLTGIKTALDILKGLKKSDTSRPILGEIADLQSALIEVQQGIMAANETHTADIQRIRELEEEVADLKAWDGEKQNYDLMTVSPGAFAYALKPEMAEGKEPHWLCANCYEQRKKSLLQFQGRSGGVGDIFSCPKCKNHLIAGFGVNPANRIRPAPR